MIKKQNKYIQILLVIIVLVIWGVILIRVLEFKEPLNNKLDVSFEELPINDKDILETNDSLSLNYLDPFLKKRGRILNYSSKIEKNTIKSSAKPASKTVSSINSAKEKEETINVEYLGCILNEELNEKVGFINFKSKLHVVKKGDEINDIVVLEVQSKSLIVKYLDKELVVPVLQTEWTKGKTSPKIDG